jgi:hypothetical protein
MTLAVICWQPPPRVGACGVLCLVELRGFEPLTSAMRTQGSHLTTPPSVSPRTVVPQFKRGIA